MLGRLRLDIETCKDIYIRIMRRVFETDKTIAAFHYRSTLFKASKLEDAIKDFVREHTIFESEGNDQGDEPNMPDSTDSFHLLMEPRSTSVASRYSQIGIEASNFR